MCTIISFNILDNYDYGLRLVYKVNRNMNTNNSDGILHSEVEARGRGQRNKYKQKGSEELNLCNTSSDDDVGAEIWHIPTVW